MESVPLCIVLLIFEHLNVPWSQHVWMSDFLLYWTVLLYLFVNAKVHNDIDQDPESSHENDWIQQHPTESFKQDEGSMA